MSKYIASRLAVERLGMSANTLRKYADAGLINFIRNEAGQRLYDVDSYTRKSESAITICYARVSSAKQKDDLQRQIAYLKEVYPASEIISDIGSGINFKRKGLLSILDRLARGDKLKLVVAHRDRLARFGYELVKYMVEQNGGEFVVLDQTIHSPDQELVTDILSIIHVFSCRIHGLRKYSRKIKEDQGLPDEEPGEDS